MPTRDAVKRDGRPQPTWMTDQGYRILTVVYDPSIDNNRDGYQDPSDLSRMEAETEVVENDMVCLDEEGRHTYTRDTQFLERRTIEFYCSFLSSTLTLARRDNRVIAAGIWGWPVVGMENADDPIMQLSTVWFPSVYPEWGVDVQRKIDHVDKLQQRNQRSSVPFMTRIMSGTPAGENNNVPMPDHIRLCEGLYDIGIRTVAYWENDPNANKDPFYRPYLEETAAVFGI